MAAMQGWEKVGWRKWKEAEEKQKKKIEMAQREIGEIQLSDGMGTHGTGGQG